MINNSSSKLALLAATLLAGSLGTAAFGSSYECDSGPESEWKSKDEARVIVEAEGYKVRKIKVEGGCYEFYTKKDGERFEVFVNPATLEIVKVKED